MRALLKSDVVQRLFSFLASLYIRFVYATSRWQLIGRNHPETLIAEGKPFIISFWHGQLGMLGKSWIWKQRKFHMLISAHKDGQLIARTVAHFGIDSIAGSTQRGGTQALRQILKSLKDGHTIGITPDGPRGPTRIASDGVAMIAKLANVPVIPLTFSNSRKINLGSWDRFHLALPFSRGAFLWGPPIYPEGETSQLRQRIEDAMNDLQKEADESVAGKRTKGYT